MSKRREMFDPWLSEMLRDPRVRYAYERAGYRLRVRPTLSRCPAPARTEWGTLRCVETLTGCDAPNHRRWRPLLPVMALIWWVKPWWPNKQGRTMDREFRKHGEGKR